MFHWLLKKTIFDSSVFLQIHNFIVLMFTIYERDDAGNSFF